MTGDTTTKTQQRGFLSRELITAALAIVLACPATPSSAQGIRDALRYAAAAVDERELPVSRSG